MKSAFAKDSWRSIRHSMGRFIAIAAIVALGTGFYAGLRMTAPDMKLAADQFYDETSLMDIRVVSTLGLTDSDVQALRAIEGVSGVMPAYETDVLGVINKEQYAFRVHSLPALARQASSFEGDAQAAELIDYLNRPILAEGSWPVNEGECVLSADLVVSKATSIGDTVQITEWQREGALVTSTYRVVGYVHSSYYATSSNMGSTSLGSGFIQQYMYVSEADFAPDTPYTELFVTVEGAASEQAGSEAYRSRVNDVVGRIENIAPEREKARGAQVRSEAQAELDTKRATVEEEKVSAYSQLDEAKRRLDEATATLSASEQALVDGQAEYDAGVAELARQRASADDQLADAERRLAEGRTQVENNRPLIESAQTQLAHGWQLWQQSAADLESGWAAWHAQADPLYDGLERMDQGIAALQVRIDELQKVDPANPLIQQLEQQKALLEQQKSDFLKLHEQDISTLEQARVTLEAAQQQVDAGKLELDAQQAAFDQQKAGFDTAVIELDEGQRAFEEASSQAAAQLAAAQQQLDTAAAQLASGREQLEQGKRDFEAGSAEYEQKKREADEKLADAERQLADAQQQIDDIEDASWLVMDREKNYGVASFEADANRVDSIASVFPFIFFLVAALVALTTMTRMVEEERILIGTYKALGYGKARIASKYLFYAASASILGSIVGIVSLSQVLPAIISEAYAIIYFVPPGPLPIDVGIAALSAGLGVGVTLTATAAAVIATLRERPAALLLPRAPRSGKRILLERIPFVWRHFSFSWKVTFRNLFRYKKRFIMTVIGIAGCTALMLTGFGLRDAINDIIDKQYGELIHYNTVVRTQDELSDDAQQQLDGLIGDPQFVSDSTEVHAQNMLVSGPLKSDQDVSLVVPQNPDVFGDFMVLRTREGQQPLKLTDNGVILSEKLARELGVGVGDTVKLGEQDAAGNATEKVYECVVSGITENYIYHYVYATPQLYERITGKEPVFSSIYARVSNDAEVRAQFSDQVRAVDGVKTVGYNDETIDSYKNMLRSVGMIVIVLVAAAAALAFIVLYNLTNINITERQREIATLKVLGFLPREVDSYIYREIMLLSIIGCLVGLVLGVYMEGFVVVTAEVNQVMFGRSIHPASFVIAFFLTIFFTVLVMLVMHRKLVRVNMVESLKSNG